MIRALSGTTSKPRGIAEPSEYCSKSQWARVTACAELNVVKIPAIAAKAVVRNVEVFLVNSVGTLTEELQVKCQNILLCAAPGMRPAVGGLFLFTCCKRLMSAPASIPLSNSLSLSLVASCFETFWRLSKILSNYKSRTANVVHGLVFPLSVRQYRPRNKKAPIVVNNRGHRYVNSCVTRG